MIKYTLLILGSLCIFNIAVHANPLSSRNTLAEHKEETGLGIGALIGGLLAGPPGAIIGAAGGAWLGNREEKEDSHLLSLEQRLLEKQGELTALKSDFQRLQGSFGQQLQKVKADRHRGVLEELSRGVSLTVYFRSDRAELEHQARPQLTRLAAFIRELPEIQVQVEAHADRRGDEAYNLALSRQRGASIVQALIDAGIDARRIHSHAYGESMAASTAGDHEAYIFDRRVSIKLTLDTHT